MTGAVSYEGVQAGGQSAPEEAEQFVGVVTRAVSWILDAIAINAVAIMAGLGTELILSLCPVSTHAASVLKPIALVAYGVWCAGYFVVLWSWTGQTLGARVMQIQLLTGGRRRVRPGRAVVRWVGMNLAMIPLFAGYAPLLFGRRGFPDWLARTVVIDVKQPSLAEARQAAIWSARGSSPRAAPAVSSETTTTSSGA